MPKVDDMNIVLNMEMANRRLDITHRRRIDNQETVKSFQFLRSAVFLYSDTNFDGDGCIRYGSSIAARRDVVEEISRARDPTLVACSHMASCVISGIECVVTGFSTMSNKVQYS